MLLNSKSRSSWRSCNASVPEAKSGFPTILKAGITALGNRPENTNHVSCVDEDGQRTCPKRRTLLGEFITNEQYNGKKVVLPIILRLVGRNTAQ